METPEGPDFRKVELECGKCCTENRSISQTMLIESDNNYLGKGVSAGIAFVPSPLAGASGSLQRSRPVRMQEVHIVFLQVDDIGSYPLSCQQKATQRISPRKVRKTGEEDTR